MLARRVAAAAASTWLGRRHAAMSDSSVHRAEGGEQGLEILVHNLSHADLLVTLLDRQSRGTEHADYPPRKARPLFNQYHYVSTVILNHIDQMLARGAKLRPIEAESANGKVYPIGISLASDETTDGASLGDSDALVQFGGIEGAAISSPWERFHLKGMKRHDRRPGSFERLGSYPSEQQLSDRSDPNEERLQKMRLRRRATTMADMEAGNDMRITAAVLPLVATVIPEWARKVERLRQKRLRHMSAGSDPKREPMPKKILVLVSGSGQPRDPKADPQDNSTSVTSLIVGRFVNLCYPEIHVVHVSSTGGMFRYDDNLAFVQHRVLPIIEELRKPVVAAHGDEWSRFLNVTLSLSDGAPARIAALNASLRPYRPNYLHLWRLKTWWDEGRLCEADVDFHAFHKLEMRPALQRSQLVGDDRLVVEEMRQYRKEFEAVRDGATAKVDGVDAQPNGGNELATFWLRKSRKAVLAVLLTRKPEEDARPVFYRGMNLEVSMPTGTLCAERNAIGNAIAHDQSLRREDIRAVAVLSVSLSKRPEVERNLSGGDESDDAADTALNPLDPCGACMEWLRKIAEVNPDFKVITFMDTTCESALVTPIEYLTI